MARDRSVDALKGLAIVLVVLGHVYPRIAGVPHDGPGLVPVDASTWVPISMGTNLIFNLIYSFHMPLFAFVSGYVLWPPRERALGVELGRRATGLIVPYFAWFAILVLLPNALRLGWSSEPARALLGAALGRGGLWYLYVLFISSTLITFLARMPKPRLSISLSAVAIVGAAAVYLAAVSTELPNIMYLADLVWVYPFVVLGYLSGAYKSSILKHRRTLITVAAVSYAVLFYLRFPIFVPELQPTAVLVAAAGARAALVLKKVMAYTCAIAGVLAIFALYLGREGHAIDVQGWLGSRSLGVYAIHGGLMAVFFSAGLRDPLGLFLVTLGLSLAGVAVIERIPLLDVLLLGRARHGTLRPSMPAEVAVAEPELIRED